MELMRISPAEVVRLALPPKEIFKLEDEAKSDSDAARKGKQQHRILLKNALLRTGLALPGFEDPSALIQATNNLLLYPEDSHVMYIGDEVVASTRVDIVMGDSVCGEIKPSLKGRHALQLMLTAMIYAEDTGRQTVDGVLYFYSSSAKPKVMIMPGGGEQFWEDGRNLCKWAAEILFNQKLINKQKELQKAQEDTGKTGDRVFARDIEWRASLLDSQRSVNLRKQFDDCKDRIKGPLVKILKT